MENAPGHADINPNVVDDINCDDEDNCVEGSGSGDGQPGFGGGGGGFDLTGEGGGGGMGGIGGGGGGGDGDLGSPPKGTDSEYRVTTTESKSVPRREKMFSVRD